MWEAVTTIIQRWRRNHGKGTIEIGTGAVGKGCRDVLGDRDIKFPCRCLKWLSIAGMKLMGGEKV